MSDKMERWVEAAMKNMECQSSFAQALNRLLEDQAEDNVSADLWLLLVKRATRQP